MKKITLILLISLSFLTIGFGQSQNNFDTIQKNEYELIADSLIVDTIFSRLDMQNKKYNWAMDKGRENEESINAINQSLQELITQIDELQKGESNEINRLAAIVQTNKENIEKTAEGIDIKIKDSDYAISEKIDSIDQTVNKGSVYWIIGLIAVALLAIVLYIILRKQMIKQKAGLDSNIQDTRKKIENTRKELEEEAIKLDGKLVEVLNTQLKLMQNEKIEPKEISKPKEEIDHTLAIKVADEIIRMQTNMSLMDEKTKGLKKLKSAVKRIQDNFAASGYELIEMLGKPYNEGMKVTIVNSKTDENLKKGEQIITRIIKPQINYQEIMIQSAQIEVSQGE